MWKTSFPPEVVVSQPIQAPDDQGIACPDVVESFIQSLALRLRAARGVSEDPGAACLLKSILLQIEGLVGGRNASIAYEHSD